MRVFLSILSLLIALPVAGGAVWLTILNPQDVTLSLTDDAHITAPLGSLCVAIAIGGFAAGALFAWGRSLVSRLRAWRAARRQTG